MKNYQTKLRSCNITSQQLNGFINRLHQLAKLNVVESSVLESSVNTVLDAMNESNPCYYKNQLSTLDKLLASYGL